ncbi:MAG: MFS transporter [Verrucomicrobiales bacterium]|nr:MFS transporter [Verrucomicrobiales bacterium]
MIPAQTNSAYERWRRRIFAITWLAYAGFYLTRKGFSVAKNELKQADVMGLTKSQMSAMDGAYSAAYAVGQFVWGPLGDRLGTRRVVLVGMMGSILAAVCMGFSHGALGLGIFFFLQGFFQSSGWAPLAKNLGEFFSQRERGGVMGFWCTNYALGGVLATLLASYAASRFGWRFAFWVPALVLLVIWGLFWLLQRNRPEDVGLPPIEVYHAALADAPLSEPVAPASGSASAVAAVPPSRSASADSGESWEVVKAVLRSPMVWILAASYFLVKPTRYLLLFWSPVYINERLGTTTAESGFLSSMFDFAGPLGTLFGGLFSDKIFGARRIPPAVIALAALAALMIAFPYLPMSRTGMGIGMFLLGFLVFIPDSLISGTAAIDFGTKRGASTANGLINGVGSLGQMVGVMLPGAVEAYLRAGQDIWLPIFVGLGIALALAALLLAPQWNRVPPQGG